MKRGKLGSSNRDRKKCIDIRPIVVRYWMWGIRKVTIGSLEMISWVVVPPILRKKRGVYEKESNDFRLGHIDFNAQAGRSCGLKLGHSQIYISNPEVQNGQDYIYKFGNHQHKNCVG